MDIIARARQLRIQIEELAETLDDAVAVDYTELFASWNEGTVYEVNTRVRYGRTLYKCLQSHTSQASWTPTDAPSLWAKVLIPDPDVIPDWEQPESTNPYMTGDKVRHNEKVWVSTVDNNVWEPGIYGWDEVVN